MTGFVCASDQIVPGILRRSPFPNPIVAASGRRLKVDVNSLQAIGGDELRLITVGGLRDVAGAADDHERRSGSERHGPGWTTEIESIGSVAPDPLAPTVVESREFSFFGGVRCPSRMTPLDDEAF